MRKYQGLETIKGVFRQNLERYFDLVHLEHPSHASSDSPILCYL